MDRILKKSPDLKKKLTSLTGASAAAGKTTKSTKATAKKPVDDAKSIKRFMTGDKGALVVV